MLFLSEINWLMLIVMATLLAAPYLVAKLALQTARGASGRLKPARIIRFCCVWAMTVIGSLGLIILQLHEFSALTLIIYFILVAAITVVSLCVMIVAFSDP